MKSMASGSTDAAASALRITSSCASTLGAVMPRVRPSWFIAEPCNSARMRLPSRCASASFFSTTRPQPSPRT